MKYSVPIVVALLVAVCIVFGVSVSYRDQKNAEKIELTTAVSTTEAETTYSDEEIVIDEIEEADSSFVYKNGSYYFIYKGIEKELPDFPEFTNEDKPQLYYYDYDGDGEKDVLLRFFVGTNSTSGESTKYYALYLVKSSTFEEGSDDFQYTVATVDTWVTPFKDSIQCEMTQLRNLKKIIQFAMVNASDSFKYDSDTGLSLDKYVGFARAQQTLMGEYCTFKAWQTGAGVYTVADDGTINLDIQILVEYEELASLQYIGDIHCEVGIVNNNGFDIVSGSLNFIAKDEYTITDPRLSTDEEWSCTVQNSNAYGDYDTEITYFSAEIDLNGDSDEISQYFSSSDGQANDISSIEFTQNTVTITAKSGYTFAERIFNKNDFSITIPDDDGENEIDVAFSIDDETGDGSTGVIVITLDRNYTREELENVTVNIGS
ncbi:MAG: hypothetical protein LIO62_07960 [Clostridiales bacterium]|nr:hypothetical protein [Clostridiales bacterium]